MAQLIFTIPDPVVAEYIDDFIRAFPVPRDENGDPEFTNNQWIRERIRRWIVAGIKKGKERLLNTPFDGTDITTS